MCSVITAVLPHPVWGGAAVPGLLHAHRYGTVNDNQDQKVVDPQPIFLNPFEVLQLSLQLAHTVL